MDRHHKFRGLLIKITLAEAKRSLGRYLKQVAAGEEIGIACGADLIVLRKAEAPTAFRKARKLPKMPAASLWPEFPTFEGGPADGALNHDEYLYSIEIVSNRT